MAYTPPAVTEINFPLVTGYVPPVTGSIDFELSPTQVYSVKTLVLDIADNWGGLFAMMCRQLDLVRSGVIAQIFNGRGATVYGSDVPPDFELENLFDARTSKINSPVGNGWQTNAGATNQRVTIVFDDVIDVDSMIAFNHHNSGTQTEYGLKNIKITVTTEVYTSTTYNAAVDQGVLVFDGVLDQHSAVNEEYPQLLFGEGVGDIFYLPVPPIEIQNQFSGGAFGGIILPVPEVLIFGTSMECGGAFGGTYAVKTVVFDFANNWGGLFAMACRQIDLVRNGARLDIFDGLGATVYGSDAGAGYEVQNLFDVRTSKTGPHLANGWQTNDGAAGFRLILVLDDLAAIDSMEVNNQHNFGADTEYGVRLARVTVTESAYTDTTFQAEVTGGTRVFDGTFLEHSASDVADTQILFGPGIDPNTRVPCPEMVITPSVYLGGALLFGGTTLICPPINIGTDLDVAGAAGGVALQAQPIEIGTDLAMSSLFAGTFLEAPPIEIGTEVEFSDVFFVGTLSVAVPEMVIGTQVAGVPELSGGIIVQCPAIIFTPDMALGAVFMFDSAEAITRYYLTITGAADGVEDIEIPFVSFQARRRSGADTYLQVVVPSTGFIDDIIARQNGTMRIDQAFVRAGEILQRHIIIETTMDQVNPYQGGASDSLVLIGYKTTTYTPKNVELENATYRAQIDGKLSYRLPTPDIFLNPGDLVTIGADEFTLGLMSYTISGDFQQIDLTEA